MCERTRKSGFLRARAAGGAKRAGDAVQVKRSKAELTAVVVTPRPRLLPHGHGHVKHEA